MQKDNKQKSDTNTLTAILIAAGAVISILLAITIIGLANKPQTIYVDTQYNTSVLSENSISSTLTSNNIISSSSDLSSSDIISSNSLISDINSYTPDKTSKDHNTYDDIRYKSSKAPNIPSNSISRVEENTHYNPQSNVNTASISSSQMPQIKKININTATAKELEDVLPIEYLMCKAIVDYRKENGLFESIEDLMNVDGIGEKLFAKIEPYITV